MRRLSSLTFLAILLGCFLFAPMAFAGGGCDGLSTVSHIFDEADEDQSGSLTADEYEAAALDQFGVTFEQSDLDGDGVTTYDEYLDLYEAHHPPYVGEEA